MHAYTANTVVYMAYARRVVACIDVERRWMRAPCEYDRFATAFYGSRVRPHAPPCDFLNSNCVFNFVTCLRIPASVPNRWSPCNYWVDWRKVVGHCIDFLLPPIASLRYGLVKRRYCTRFSLYGGLFSMGWQPNNLHNSRN